MPMSTPESRRQNLQHELEEFTGRPVFFQPLSNVRLSYPCTIYKLNGIYVNQANDMNYKASRRYQITYITKNAADPLINEFITKFKMITFSNHFTSDNLHHYIYDIYY